MLYLRYTVTKWQHPGLPLKSMKRSGVRFRGTHTGFPTYKVSLSPFVSSFP